jgi:hypothetical protein
MGSRTQSIFLIGEHCPLWRQNFGSYFGVRAAAFETRIKACIAISRPFNFNAFSRSSVDSLPDAHTQHKFGEEAEMAAREFNLDNWVSDA